MMDIEFTEHNGKEVFDALRERPCLHSRTLLPILMFRSHDTIEFGRYDFRMEGLVFHKARIEPWDYHPDDVRFDGDRKDKLYKCSDYYVVANWG